MLRALLVFPLMVGLMSIGAVNAEKVSSDEFRTLVESYYQLESKDDYEGLYALFQPGAEISIEFDFGSWYPSQKVDFKLDSLEQLNWEEGMEGAGDMSGYKILGIDRTIGEPEAFEGGKRLKVTTVEKYDWEGEKGSAQTEEWFYFKSENSALKISKFTSLTNF